jgi:CrcB protein
MNMNDIGATASPSKAPFISVDGDVPEEQGSSSPFHAMVEYDGGPNLDNLAMVIAKDSSISSDRDDDDNSTLKVHQGHADFDSDIKVVSKSKWHFGKTKRGAIKLCYLSVFAVLGAFLRMILAQLFGEECKNPGTVGWLKAGQPLCVTGNGEMSIEGGIIFADLPANLLGSFIMGLMQNTDSMNLPKSLPIAWLHEDNFFQSDDVIHLAIRTGFCGSLTTFSSWNSEMVVMMLGADADRGSLIIRALIGYLVGVETALASFILGKNIAKYIHRKVNPALQTEADEIERLTKYGLYVNTQLTDYERRFLSGFNMGEYDIYINADAAGELERWRFSTQDCRRYGHELLPLLTDIEYQTLVLDEPLQRDLVAPAIAAGWDIESLEKWAILKRSLKLKGGYIEPHDFKFTPAFLLFSAVILLLAFGLFFENQDDAYSVTYRMMLYAGLLSPLGALLRWKLSKLNGRLKKCDWFPAGTFVANLIASIFSAAMIGLETRYYNGSTFWSMGSVRAVKVGFAGCLSTVSTFISEVSGFLKSKHPLHGYIYIFTSLSTCAICGAIAYTIVAIPEDTGDDGYY